VSWLFCFVCWTWVACKIYLTQVGGVVFTRIFALGKGYVAHLLNLERPIYPSRRTELCCVVRPEWVKFMFLGGRERLWSLNCRYNCMLWWYPIGNKPEMCFVLVAGKHSHQIQGPSHWPNNLVVIQGQIILAKWQGFNCFKSVSVQFNAESKKFPPMKFSTSEKCSSSN